MAGDQALKSKDILVNRDNICELANLTAAVLRDFSNLLHAEQVTDDVSHTANKEVYEHQQVALFYCALVRGSSSWSSCPLLNTSSSDTISTRSLRVLG